MFVRLWYLLLKAAVIAGITCEETKQVSLDNAWTALTTEQWAGILGEQALQLPLPAKWRRVTPSDVLAVSGLFPSAPNEAVKVAREFLASAKSDRLMTIHLRANGYQFETKPRFLILKKGLRYCMQHKKLPSNKKLSLILFDHEVQSCASDVRRKTTKLSNVNVALCNKCRTADVPEGQRRVRGVNETRLILACDFLHGFSASSQMQSPQATQSRPSRIADQVEPKSTTTSTPQFEKHLVGWEQYVAEAIANSTSSSPTRGHLGGFFKQVQEMEAETTETGESELEKEYDTLFSPLHESHYDETNELAKKSAENPQVLQQILQLARNVPIDMLRPFLSEDAQHLLNMITFEIEGETTELTQ